MFARIPPVFMGCGPRTSDGTLWTHHAQTRLRQSLLRIVKAVTVRKHRTRPGRLNRPMRPMM